ncbi:MAG TPA: hypothetical protein VM598_06215, partial [Bdellovibrionota bacterium]|nr:hypothetical protein [Bdellovibrionota bacterium]
VHGNGTLDGAQANLLTVGFSKSIDSLGCRETAKKAVTESRQLLIEGEGWITTWDYWASAESSPGSVGGTGGTVSARPASGQTQMCILIYPPPPGCEDPTVPQPPQPPHPLFSYSVAADKLVRCELGGPAPRPPVMPMPEPAPAPL